MVKTTLESRFGHLQAPAAEVFGDDFTKKILMGCATQN
jgi:hypothetical protein